jgi:CRISPR-associated endonuclease/helicase Cas3
VHEKFVKDFQILNRDLTRDGPSPLKWQTRLFSLLCANNVPRQCDLPTGMGKTSIIHLWLLALLHQIRENQARLPTRLIYVVDRRTVVDQATAIAMRIRDNLPAIALPPESLSVSTLRGQLADSGEWTLDPARPAIVIGTVDMIGSRLLFSGYRSSYKQRPLHAGLLGQDSLLVLDEAHLSRPFEKLVRELDDRGRFQMNQGSPMRVMTMSATLDLDDQPRFKLEEEDVEGHPDTNPIIRRYEAKKRLTFQPVEKNKLKDAAVKAAIEFAELAPSRIVVFVQKPDEAIYIANAIRKKHPHSAEVLTGTMRGLERDALLTTTTLRRFLDGEEKPEETAARPSVFLVSTSAGEVGFDLNADHMICDAAPIDSMIQRLGRVNRRGHAEARVTVLVPKKDEKQDAKKSPGKKSSWDETARAAAKCLEGLAADEDGTYDASPKALAELKRTYPVEFNQALSPAPETVELTDILLDAWSMTTIVGPMPGRPPVAPWIRGISDEEPQTSIAWRAELDIPGFDELEIDDIEEWFDSHRVLPHETLSVPTSKAAEWLHNRWQRMSPELQNAVGKSICVVEQAGLRTARIKDLIEKLDTKRPDAIRGADIVVPASFGGVDKGFLAVDASDPIDSSDGAKIDPRKASDVADCRPSDRRMRLLLDGDQPPEPLVPVSTPTGDLAQFTIDLRGEGDAVLQLVSRVPKFQRLEYGTDKQSLKCHVGLVEKHAADLSRHPSLSNSTFAEAFSLAAKWHDAGKKRVVWQRAVGAKPNEPPVGKSGGAMRRIVGGYRHEFGSMREFHDAFQGKVSDDIFDLAMHLIAAHHGRARPHFPKGGSDPDAPAVSPAIATDGLRRFARLQRRYGYWQLAWLENLLRCADAAASKDKCEPI